MQDATTAGICEQHGNWQPCGRCAAEDGGYAKFLHGQNRIAGMLAERVRAAQSAVDVLARYIAFEAGEDKWEIGSAELADAATGAGEAAAALRGVGRIADLYAARVARDLAEAEKQAAS